MEVDDGLAAVYRPRPPLRQRVDTAERGRLNGMPGYMAAVDGGSPVAGTWLMDDCCQLECALLTDVLGEVRYLTGKMRQETHTQRICSEWKFAAMVVDRLCLWLFSIVTLVSSGAIFLSAPDVADVF